MAEEEEDAMAESDDEFTLWDLRVEVIAGDKPMVCNHREGDFFELSGENLSLPGGQTFPIYPLAALLPLLPAKQRDTHPNDWMTTDAIIACPDPALRRPIPDRPNPPQDLPPRRGDHCSPGRIGHRSRGELVIERVELAPGYSVCRVINGLWQLSRGHGPTQWIGSTRSVTSCAWSMPD